MYKERLATMPSKRSKYGVDDRLQHIITDSRISISILNYFKVFLNNVSKRTLQIDNILNNLQGLKNTPNPEMIKKIEKEMEDLLRTVQKSPIRQTSLDEGEIELF